MKLTQVRLSEKLIRLKEFVLLRKSLLLLCFLIASTVAISFFANYYIKNAPRPQYFASSDEPYLSDAFSVTNKSEAVQPIPVYSYTLPPHTEALAKAREAAKKLGLGEETFYQNTNLYAWKNQQWLLTLSTMGGIISLQNVAIKPLAEQKINTAEMYTQLAANFLSDYFGYTTSREYAVSGSKLDQPLNLESPLTGTIELVNADRIDLASYILIDNLTVYAHSNSPAAINFTFTPDGQLVSARFPWGILHAVRTAALKPQSADKAIRSIVQKTGNTMMIVKTDIDNSNIDTKPVGLRSMTIEKASIGYYFNATPSETHLFPVYTFSGPASDGTKTYPLTVFVKL